MSQTRSIFIEEIAPEEHKVEVLTGVNFDLKQNRTCIQSEHAELCFSIKNDPQSHSPSFESWLSGKTVFKTEKSGNIFISSGNKVGGIPIAIKIPKKFVAGLLNASKEMRKLL